MTYAEFSEGDVYLHDTPEGSWVCCGCRLTPMTQTHLYGEAFAVRGNRRFADLEQVEDHIYEHLNNGHQIPPRCLKLIEEELKEEMAR